MTESNSPDVQLMRLVSHNQCSNPKRINSLCNYLIIKNKICQAMCLPNRLMGLVLVGRFELPHSHFIRVVTLPICFHTSMKKVLCGETYSIPLSFSGLSLKGLRKPLFRWHERYPPTTSTTTFNQGSIFV